MCLISSASLLVWELVKGHPGIVFVLVGVFGEIVLEWKKTKGKLACLKKAFWVLLIFGLVLEFWEASKADNEVASTKLKVEQLRAKNDELEAKQRRIITPEQHDKFINILKKKPKSPVKIFVGEADHETRNYAKQIRRMLDDAGYDTGKTNDIIEEQDWAFSNPIGDPSTDLPIIFIFFGTPNEPIDWPGLKITPDKKGGETVTGFENDKHSVPGIVWDAFKQIGIYPAFGTRTNWPTLNKKGDWLIFIPEKF